jgi:hypothetical protein
LLLVVVPLGLVLVGAFAVALIATRTIKGTVPGRAALLSLGVIDDGFLVGTAEGAYTSSDSVSWRLVKGFNHQRTLITSNGNLAVALSGTGLYKTSDLRSFDKVFQTAQRGVALALDSKNNIYVAEDNRHLDLIKTDGSLQRVTATTGPQEVLALDAEAGDPALLFAGGLRSGLWRSFGGESGWRHVSRTPTTAIFVDPNNEDRVFIGTARGILVSKDKGLSWRSTSFHVPVVAMAEHRGRYFVLASNQSVYVSSNGISDFKRFQGRI